jgi:hypothetical protein
MVAGSSGLLDRKVWGWWVFLVYASLHVVFWGYWCWVVWYTYFRALILRRLAYGADTGAWLFLALLFCLATVVILLRDRPRFWAGHTD